MINENITVEDFLGESVHQCKTMSQDMMSFLDRLIAIGELDQVVQNSHMDSLLGLSGISYGLMKHIWPLVRTLFFKMTQKCLNQDKETLPYIMRMRRIILLLKPSKQPDDDNSY
jgi:hypothetical protein